MVQEETLACCVLSHLLTYSAVLLARRVCRDKPRYSEYINELACTAMWLSWCFENLVLKSVITNQIIYRAIQFLALLVQMYIYQGAYANSCLVFLGYLRKQLSQEKAVRLLACQLLAVPVSVVVILVLWQCMSGWSSHHGQAWSGTFLNVTIPSGLICEALVTVFALLPTLIIDDKFVLNIVASLNFVILDVMLGHTTGAFFNPLPITSFSMLYRTPDWVEVVLVYWGGSAVGGLIFYALLRQRSKAKLS